MKTQPSTKKTKSKKKIIKKKESKFAYEITRETWDWMNSSEESY